MDGAGHVFGYLNKFVRWVTNEPWEWGTRGRSFDVG